MIKRDRLIVVGLVLASVLLVIWAISYGWSRAGCAWYGYQTERTVTYRAFMGCMVRVNDHWVPQKELRTVQ